MLKYDEQHELESVKGALAIRGEVEKVVDEVCEKGYDLICYMGIGGTYASALQTESHIKELSDLPILVENAARYNTLGNKRITDKSLIVISSVSGNTAEMVTVMDKLNKIGATSIGFIDVADSTLAKQVSYCITYPENEQLKFFMVADRLMKNVGQFPQYNEYYSQLDAHLAEDLVSVAKASDEFAQRFAEEHHDDKLHYFVGAGEQYGSTYSYAMCYWEEQHWIRTKSIHAAEFFHGMFEIVDRDTNVTVFLGEDAERPLSERVAKFLPKVCSRYTFVDSKDYELEGISEKYRGYLSHLVTHQVTNRIDIHIERLNCHPMEIRRYYRQLQY
ncbi:SIS domain-containing protein [Olegusella massiliensis]|uniref:SIS domain-containing protein n=1 Tax=Olegusella massiliensis TaxID=1776381 RepID=UPI00083926DE|nr:SIS domain-containing protein [Olegusella massiliensis]MBS5865658.1 SIS domain-containing protein [Coriobacteriaceae bacterium]